MKKTKPGPEDLIAPCGMNCAICSRYLTYVNNLGRSKCTGCRPGNKKCSYLFEKCSGMNADLEGNETARFCFDCDQYPCKEIDRMDDRYRSKYHMSVKDNLLSINKIGIVRFTEEQNEKYSCPRCAGFVSIHNGKCFECETITKLVEIKRY
jgi:hypothetical protein